jgi:CheY-like chemotaxis protein
MVLRADQTDAHLSGQPGRGGEPRLNLLLSYGGWRQDSFAEQLPCVLRPLGIHSIRVESGDEAARVIRQVTVHIAVVDLDIPLNPVEEASPQALQPGGARILQILRNLQQPPPTVVVRPRQAAARESGRTLAVALRAGAFAVLDQPVRLETMLEVMRRILRRHYADNWPG